MMLSRRAIIGAIPAVLGTLTLNPRQARATDFKIIFYNTYAPFSAAGDDHEIVGILPDMMKDIMGRRLG